MKPSLAISCLFFLYNLAWALLIPVLNRKKRIADGFDQRMGRDLPQGPVDLWIQSASAGESYLSAEILNGFDPELTVSIWLTTNTRQGLDILLSEQDKLKQSHPGLHIHVSFAPFDKPSLMNRVVRAMRPRLMVLVELEVWPGLLRALKENDSHVLVVNGRLTEKSLSRYLFMPSLWDYLAPDAVCAISKDDAGRFSSLFPSSHVAVVPNIKFDRFGLTLNENSENPIIRLFNEKKPMVVLGSVRQEEETEIERIILALIDQHPDLLILLFPRHMHRITYWAGRLRELAIPFTKRTHLPGAKNDFRVVVWDRFGELGHAYALALAAFVGGSLAPLGGQNFLEVLSCGLIPVSGPSWENFAWVGQDIVNQGLFIIEPDGPRVAERLLSQVQDPEPKDAVRQRSLAYLERNKGGTRITCEQILSYLTAQHPKGLS